MKLFGIALAAVLAVSLGAAELDVNGSFKPGKNGLPEGYRLITDKERVGTAVMQDGAVKLTSQKGVLILIYSKSFPVIPGEKYVLEAQFKGTGKAGVGVQYWSDKGVYLRGDYAQAVNCAKVEKVRREITIAEIEGRGKQKAPPAKVGFLVFVDNKSEAVFTNFKVEKVQ